MQEYKKRRFIASLSIILLCVLSAFPVIGSATTLLGSALLFLFTLISFFIYSRDLSKEKWKTFIVILLPFLIFLLPLTYTESISEGLRIIEKRAVVIVFPLIMILSPVSFKNKRFLFYKIFVFALAVFSLYLFIRLGIDLHKALNKGLFEGNIKVFFSSPDLYYILRMQISKHSFMHPTYLSMYLLFAVILVGYITLTNRSDERKIVTYSLTIAALIIFILSLILAARTPLLAFIVVFSFLLFRLVKSKSRLILAYSLAAVLLVLGFLTIPSLKQRYLEVNNSNFELPTEGNTNSTTIRVGIYDCSFNLLKENWLLGTGTGTLQSRLNDCYKKFNNDVFNKLDYNTHNEYLNVLLTTGILGFLLFISGFIMLLKKAIRNEDLISICFLAFLVICMITENIFSRYHGNIFYSFITGLHFLNINNSNKTISFALRT